MSYKKIIIDNILSSSNKIDLDDRVFDSIKSIYIKAIEDSRKTGQSIESITYEIMEGVENSLDKLENKEEILNLVSKNIIKVLYSNIKTTILKSKQRALFANKKYYDTIEKEKDNLVISIETLKDYAKDNHYNNFEKNLKYMEIKVLQWIKQIDKENK